MTATEIFDHVATLEDEVRRLRGQLAHSVDVTRFDQVRMTTEEVARFLGMRPSTIRNYAHHGLIEFHPDSSDGKMLFNASAVLRLTREELKKAKRHVKWELGKTA